MVYDSRHDPSSSYRLQTTHVSNIMEMDPALEILQTPEGNAVPVSTQWFLDHVLPPLPSDVSAQRVLQKWKAAHKKSSSQKPITNHGRWKGFTKDPSLSSASPRSTFKHLCSIVDSITKATSTTTSERTRYLHINPAPVPMLMSDRRDNDSLPDAFFVSRDTEGELDWSDVQVVGEYRKFNRYGDAKCVSYQITLSNTPSDLQDALEHVEGHEKYGQNHAGGSVSSIRLWLHDGGYQYEAVVLR